MPTVTRENLGELQALLTVELSQGDYLPLVNKKLKEYRQKIQLKGFRPGQAPMDLIKRRFGLSTMVDEINELLNTTLGNYIEEQKLAYLGQPLAVEDPSIKFDLNRPKDYTFKFELGLAPDFEIAGLSMEHSLPFHEVQVEEERVDEEIENLRKRFGTDYETDVQTLALGDMMGLDLEELDEEGQVKENGIKRQGAMLSIDRVASQTLKNAFLALKLGESLTVENIYEIEDTKRENIRRYLLDTSPKQQFNPSFKATLTEIKRLGKAELNEEFYSKIFPREEEPIKDLDTFRSRLSDELLRQYQQLARQSFYRKVFKHLVEQNRFELPSEFLKKWLRHSHKASDESLEQEFEGFCDNVRWNLVRGKLAERFEVEVTEYDIRNYIRGEVLRYFQYQVQPFSPMVEDMINRVMKDQQATQRRYEMLLDEAVLAAAAEEVGKDTQSIGSKAFTELYEAETKDIETDTAE